MSRNWFSYTNPKDLYFADTGAFDLNEVSGWQTKDSEAGQTTLVQVGNNASYLLRGDMAVAFEHMMRATMERDAMERIRELVVKSPTLRQCSSFHPEKLDKCCRRDGHAGPHQAMGSVSEIGECWG